jgi:hypothetical protein
MPTPSESEKAARYHSTKPKQKLERNAPELAGDSIEYVTSSWLRYLVDSKDGD